MKITLKDGAPRFDGSVEVNVSKAGNTLEIGGGDGPAPVVLEFYEGKLTLRVYGPESVSKAVYRATLEVYTSAPTATPGDPARMVSIQPVKPAPATEPAQDDDGFSDI